LSVTAPSPFIEKDPTKAAALARELNDYVAKLRDNNPQGFRLFRSVPSLLNTKACLKKIAYVFNALHADDVTLFTRYGPDNHYPSQTSNPSGQGSAVSRR
jgi:6-methylsalicylate decarboxylase